MLCYKCNKIKPDEDFTSPKSMCIDCRKRGRKLTLLKHAEKNRIRCSEWYEKNKLLVSSESRSKYKEDPKYRAKKRSDNKKWDEANKEKMVLWNKEYRKINAEELSLKKKEYAVKKKKNPLYMENERKRGREYYANNKEACNERVKEYLNNNREHLNKKSLERSHKNIEAVRASRNKSVKTWNDNNPIKKKAQSKLQKQVAMKKIIKPSICSICGNEFKSRDIIGHHHDYLKPLDVIWCCRKCHGAIHRISRKD